MLLILLVKWSSLFLLIIVLLCSALCMWAFVYAYVLALLCALCMWLCALVSWSYESVFTDYVILYAFIRSPNPKNPNPKYCLNIIQKEIAARILLVCLPLQATMHILDISFTVNDVKCLCEAVQINIFFYISLCLHVLTDCLFI